MGRKPMPLIPYPFHESSSLMQNIKPLNKKIDSMQDVVSLEVGNLQDWRQDCLRIKFKITTEKKTWRFNSFPRETVKKSKWFNANLKASKS